MLFFFFFNDTATTEIYTLSLHDALPICSLVQHARQLKQLGVDGLGLADDLAQRCTGDLDRKSTRLNSSHANISYAVFCLKKKKTKYTYKLLLLLYLPPLIVYIISYSICS